LEGRELASHTAWVPSKKQKRVKLPKEGKPFVKPKKKGKKTFYNSRDDKHMECKHEKTIASPSRRQEKHSKAKNSLFGENRGAKAESRKGHQEKKKGFFAGRTRGGGGGVGFRRGVNLDKRTGTSASEKKKAKNYTRWAVKKKKKKRVNDIGSKTRGARGGNKMPLPT